MLLSHHSNVINNIVNQQQGTRTTRTKKAFSHQNSIHANCSQALSLVREVRGMVCQSDSPSLKACPKALSCTEEHEVLATHQI